MLGLFKIELPPGPKGEVKVKVAIGIDVNGILNITATESSGKYFESLKIKNDKEIIGEKEFNELKNRNQNIFSEKELNQEKNYKKKLGNIISITLKKKILLIKLSI